jgi:L-asparaginase II
MDTDLMVAANRRVPRALCKVGGEAVHGTALLSDGLGLAVKIADGEFRPLGPALVHAMEQLGYVTDLLAWERGREEGSIEGPTLMGLLNPPVKNHPGAVVGELDPSFTLFKRVHREDLSDRGIDVSQLP